MANVTLDEKTLYYQYMINHNSTSTMLNAISGNSSDNGWDALSSLSSLGYLGGTGSIGDFSTILQNYLTGVNTNSYEETMEAAEMADRLSAVLDVAAKTEDTTSLTYKTAQELYEYFSEKVSAKASKLMGGVSSKTDGTSESTTASAGMASATQAVMQEEEFDFSQIDDMVEAAFAERMPLS